MGAGLGTCILFDLLRSMAVVIILIFVALPCMWPYLVRLPGSVCTNSRDGLGLARLCVPLITVCNIWLRCTTACILSYVCSVWSSVWRKEASRSRILGTEGVVLACACSTCEELLSLQPFSVYWSCHMPVAGELAVPGIWHAARLGAAMPLLLEEVAPQG
jgi:hypothetical protein